MCWRTTLAMKGKRQRIIINMISVNKIVNQIPIIYTPLNSNRARNFNIRRCFISSRQLYKGMSRLRVRCIYLLVLTLTLYMERYSTAFLCILTSKRNASSKTLHNWLHEHPTCAKVLSMLIFVCISLNNILKISFSLNGGGPTILKDAPCAHGTNFYATKFHKSLWKLFYKQEIIKFRKETKMGSVKKK